jgi:hypothetical protein
MVLLEEVEGLWLPFTPPVTGAYDHYGHVEVWIQQVNEHTDHVVERLDALRASGALVLKEGERFDKKKTETELYLDGSRRRIPKITTWLSMTNAFERDAITIEGRSVMPLVYVDQAADAIQTSLRLRARDPHEVSLSTATAPGSREVYADWLEEKGRTALARHVRALAKRGSFGKFGKAHPSVDVRAFEGLMEWLVERPSGLRPTPEDHHGQFGDEEEGAFAREAASIDPLLAKLVKATYPELEGVVVATAAPQVAGRAYKASERFSVGEVVSHPTFGLGVVEELRAPNKVVITFGVERKVLVHARA